MNMHVNDRHYTIACNKRSVIRLNLPPPDLKARHLNDCLDIFRLGRHWMGCP